MDQARRAAVIIWAGMVFGLVTFAAVIAGLSTQGMLRRNDGLTVLVVLAAGVVVALVALALLVPPRLGAGLPPPQRASLRLLVRAACLEGACLFCLVTVLVTLDGRAAAASAVPFTLLLLQFPSETRWAALQEIEP